MVQDQRMARQDISSIAGQDELLMDVIWLAPHSEEAFITATATATSALAGAAVIGSALLNRVKLDGLCCLLKYLRPPLSFVSLSSVFCLTMSLSSVSLCLLCLCLCLCLCSSSSNARAPTPQILTDKHTCIPAHTHTHTHKHTHVHVHNDIAEVL
jgi:hypothetical protein